MPNEHMEKKNMVFMILGRFIGTYTGWDRQDTFEIMAYDFKPYPGVDLPSGDVSFDLETGLATCYKDDDNNEVLDFAEKIMHIPVFI